MKKCLLLVVCASALFAKEFGRRAETYPIVEKDFFEWLQEQLQGKEEVIKQELEKWQEEIAQPPALEGISKAKQYRSWTHDLSAVVDDGSMLNPLDMVSVQDMLFFDAADPAQLAWAQKQADDALWCLVKGNPAALQEQLGRPVFYDQLGMYTSKFKIEHVPARVSQQGNLLLIEEVVL